MNSFKEKIFEGLASNPNKKREVIDYMLSIKQFKSLQDFKNVFEVFMENKELASVYTQHVVDLIHEYYHQSQPKADIQEYLSNYLENEIEFGSNFGLYYAIFKKYQADINYVFPISEDELKIICVMRLRKYVDELKGDDIFTAFTLYYTCRDYVDKNYSIHILKEANVIIQRYIRAFPDKYLPFLIRPKISPFTSWRELVLEPFTKQIWCN